MNKGNSTFDYLKQIQTEKVNQQSAHIDSLDGEGIARLMNAIDADTLQAVQSAAKEIGKAIDCIAEIFQNGGRLIYLGAGTSGRLGVLDASECPPTFGVDSDMVIGIIAGGDTALRSAIEGAEDDAGLAVEDLKNIQLSAKDVVVAISASGFAPYCISALDFAKAQGAVAVSLCCNEHARLSAHADIAIEAPTGAEVLSGSTRLKAGTATKMILNMLTTGAMIRIGKSYQNLMVDLKPTNDKLRDRSIRLVMHALNLDRPAAEKAYQDAGSSIKAAIVMYKTSVSRATAEAALASAKGFVAKAIQEIQSRV